MSLIDGKKSPSGSTYSEFINLQAEFVKFLIFLYKCFLYLTVKMFRIMQ